MAKSATLDSVWSDLSSGVTSILEDQRSGLSKRRWMELYTLVHNYCTANVHRVDSSQRAYSGAELIGASLYDRLHEQLQKYAEGLLERKSLGSVSGPVLLERYRAAWDEFIVSARVINRIFDYLNRHWVKRERGDRTTSDRDVFDINSLCLYVWRTYLFDTICDKLQEGILALIKKDRMGEQVDASLVAHVVKSFVMLGIDPADLKATDLSVYRLKLERVLIDETRQFYKAESSDFITANSVSDFMKKVEARLEEESFRVQRFLHGSSEDSILPVCRDVLISNHHERLWDEFDTLLNEDKQDDLGRMYALLNSTNELEPLKAKLEAHITAQGLEAVEKVQKAAMADPKVFVDALLEVWRKYHSLVVKSFRSDHAFMAALDKACRKFVNENAVTTAAKSSSKSPELLARFCDNLLKKSSKLHDEAELDAILNDVMVVFKYVEDKDVFQKFYSRRLSSRLIQNTSASEDAESNMISKLKAACGYEYTTKLQRMFTDISLSREINEAFRTHLDNSDSQDLGLDFTCLVLQSGSWPLQPPTSTFSAPVALEKCTTKFSNFYQHRHNGRKLAWLYQLSKLDVRTHYLQPQRTFQVTTYQYAVLQCFDAADEQKVETLAKITLLTPGSLSTTLEALCEAKILICDNAKPQQYEASEVVKLNLAFQSKRTRIVVAAQVKSEQKQETEATHKNVDDDRKLLIQAAIVRVMKARRTLDHNNLMTEVINQLQSRFKPKIPQIKKCVDMLLEKEYIERSPDNVDVFNYIT